VSRRDLPYAAPLQPYLSWFGLCANMLILMTNGFTAYIRWSTSDFFASYVSVMLFVVLYVGHKAVFRTKTVALEEVDLARGREDVP